MPLRIGTIAMWSLWAAGAARVSGGPAGLLALIALALAGAVATLYGLESDRDWSDPMEQGPSEAPSPRRRDGHLLRAAVSRRRRALRPARARFAIA
ncbi:hypothetical protein WPS_11010 [Vulcanimicrobium alpinum]|uniref:Uncharacterized protein n=1 Tax=Vulcanimicrobium alpinum TaxID=3016050 RepID=A0AAN1XUQ8_UNVUL|nr:hypothetical protein WPS_11010 [Vulcanimicrobium alpinum]